VKLAERLDTASAVFFCLGFVASQLQYSPFTLLSALSSVSALFLYSIAYSIWLVACYLYPNYPREKNHWYGFAEIKKQQLLAAAIGAMAIIIYLVGLILPVLLVPASWLLFISNLAWCIGEYHKQHNPSFQKKYSKIKQASYVYYAAVNTLTTLVPAVAATIALFFPPAALFACFISTILGVCLGSMGIYCWLEYQKIPETYSEKGSYSMSMKALKKTKTYAKTPVQSVNPEHHHSLLKKRTTKAPEITLEVPSLFL
jgi:hypothetical protein